MSPPPKYSIRKVAHVRADPDPEDSSERLFTAERMSTGWSPSGARGAGAQGKEQLSTPKRLQRRDWISVIVQADPRARAHA